MANNKSEATLLLAIKTAGDDVLSKTGEALAGLGKIAAAAYAAANAAAAASIAAYREQEQATNSLNQALINQGIYSKKLSEEYQKMAGDLQKITTYADENIVSAQAQLQKYLGQTKITKELTMATLDFATAMHMDLDSAATAIGKSIGTSTNALGRYGIQVDANAPKTVKLAEVMHGLNGRFGGQAVAAASGLGALKQMSNAMGDILEAAGEKLAPVVTALAREMTHFAEEVQKNDLVLQSFTTAAKLLAQGAVALKNLVVGLGETIGQVFGTVISAAMQLASMKAKEALRILQDGFSDTAKSVGNRYDILKEELATIDKVFAQQKQVEADQELANIKRSNESKARLARELNITQEQMFAARDEKELLKLEAQEDAKIREKLVGWNRVIYGESTVTQKLEAENEKRKYLEDAYLSYAISKANFGKNALLYLESEKVSGFQQVLSNMEQMQNSSNSVLVGIGKAAAVANITINTAKGAMGAVAWGTENVGPELGLLLGAPIAAYGALRLAEVTGLVSSSSGGGGGSSVASPPTTNNGPPPPPAFGSVGGGINNNSSPVQLAEGGIVKATPGGIQATIGEGGRDEMVIPLNKAGKVSSGGGVHLTVYGGFLGNENQAREFAIALDKELLRLRQSNQSLAFDKGVI